MDIRAWLEGQGLDQYAEAFASNDIDADVLRTLSAEDLKELGVASLGHRKKLLAAIAGLDTSPPKAGAGDQRSGASGLHAEVLGRAHPRCPGPAYGRAQARDGAVRRHQRLA